MASKLWKKKPAETIDQSFWTCPPKAAEMTFLSNITAGRLHSRAISPRLQRGRPFHEIIRGCKVAARLASTCNGREQTLQIQQESKTKNTL